MSTAILISGQMRTFDACFRNQRWAIFRHLEDPHFFITVEDNAQTASIDLLRRAYGSDRVNARLLAHPDHRPEVDVKILAAAQYAPYANSSELHRLLSQHWWQNEVWKDYQAFVAQSPAKLAAFDTIIRIRPDLWFHSSDIRGVLCPEPETCHSPWWGRFGGINDRFAIMGPIAAFAYFTVYPQIPRLLSEGCPFHPESLLAACLEHAGVVSLPCLRAEFSTLRLDGTSRPPEISPIDIAHASMAA